MKFVVYLSTSAAPAIPVTSKGAPTGMTLGVGIVWSALRRMDEAPPEWTRELPFRTHEIEAASLEDAQRQFTSIDRAANAANRAQLGTEDA